MRVVKINAAMKLNACVFKKRSNDQLPFSSFLSLSLSLPLSSLETGGGEQKDPAHDFPLISIVDAAAASNESLDTAS